ncbi:protein Tube isoform X2 [Diachasmimorpha longicaudata]|uniref:protein Tube isoform X2 n=1 Tax=Diachasmimorpha longicaudata TaxID=58733 RepID=UPI0030B89E34
MVNANTEIRKLTVGELSSLARSLSPESWKILMASIKIPGSKDIPRFTSEDVRLIEEAGKNQQRPAAEVFLSEWCSMGKTRPTVGSMIQLLIETNLLRAADYLAVDILKGKPPLRPQEGPAAVVDLSKLLEDLNPRKSNSPENEDAEFWNRSTAEAGLNNINCPEGDIRIIAMNFIEEQNKNVQDGPQREPDESSDLIKLSNSSDTTKDQKSDMIKFSSNLSENEEFRGNGDLVETTNFSPRISLLGIKPSQNTGNNNVNSSSTQNTSSIDSFECIISETDSQTTSMESSDFNLPAMSEILPDDLKPKNDESEGTEQEIDACVISGSVQNLPVTILELFKR